MTASSATTLDLILSPVEPLSECEVVQIDISDHLAVRGKFPGRESWPGESGVLAAYPVS